MYRQFAGSEAFTQALNKAYVDCACCLHAKQVREQLLRKVVCNTMEQELKGGYEAMAAINLGLAEADLVCDTLLLEFYETDLCQEER